MSRHSAQSLATVVAAAIGLLAGAAHAASSGAVTDGHPQNRTSRTIHFSYRDEELLVTGQKESSVVYLPRTDLPSMSEPLLVLLHGVNESRTMYPWFGGTHDLRPMLKALAASASGRGFVVAAPTQTRNAWLPSTIWDSFDLDEFLGSLRAALPSGHDIDLEAVYIAGHSAADCNPQGGLAMSTSTQHKTKVAGVAFVDTCFDVRVARQLASRDSRLPIWVMWQNMTWQRDLAPFLAELTIPEAPTPRVVEFKQAGANPHVGTMFLGVEMLAREVLLHESAPEQAARKAEGRAVDFYH